MVKSITTTFNQQVEINGNYILVMVVLNGTYDTGSNNLAIASVKWILEIKLIGLI